MHLSVFDGTTLIATGSVAEIAARHAPAPKRGRPKLGVASREVTLLPRHWDWLTSHRQGASATLRRLVEAAIRAEGGCPDPTRARKPACRVATALAGDLPGYEEAMRSSPATVPRWKRKCPAGRAMCATIC